MINENDDKSVLASIKEILWPRKLAQHRIYKSQTSSYNNVYVLFLVSSVENLQYLEVTKFI